MRFAEFAAGCGAGARGVALAALLALSAGCATNGGGDARDPAEGFNRAMYSFNDGFDQMIGKPVSTAYRDVIPGPVRGWVRNVYANIADLFIGFNSLIQGKPADAVTDWARFAVNTTLGILGINDVASDIGLEKHDEDFGQTFGRWGLSDGAYIVWPLYGSSSLRDSAGLIFDLGLDPVFRHRPKDARNLMLGLRTLNKRADLLDASRILEEAALDKYVFQRDAYLQRRRNQVYDGSPPRAQRDTPRAEAGDRVPEPHAAFRLLEEPAAGPAAGPGPLSQELGSPAFPQAVVAASPHGS